ncbi:MAG: carboxypeptidase regulatory-like domain-containing protein, partial [Acidobacteria bacterium]|nr:carboxypeptidase regulatory-like domain-containing protein [Acidobacteriota bacterium]
MKAWLVFPLAWFLCAQAPEPATVEGQAVSGASGEPLKKAHVMLLTTAEGGKPPYSAATDAAGKFLITGVDPGHYRLQVQRNGFVYGEYGARGPGRQGTVISLEPGGRLKDLLVRLTPQGVIAGRILDEDGDPVEAVSVQALRYQYVRGRRELVPGRSAMTNDLGEYRLHGLAPGQYYIAASTPGFRGRMGGVPSGPRRMAAAEGGYLPTFYPGTVRAASAAPVDIAPGSEIRSLSITLQRARTLRVSGRVVAPPGTLLRGVGVTLLPRDGNWSLQRKGGPVLDEKGSFDIGGVAPGSYLLAADIWQDRQRASARLPIEVADTNLEGLTLALSEGAEVSGRIRVENDAPADFARLRIWLEPAGDWRMMGSAGASSANSDGTFRLSNIGPDPFHVNVSGMPEGFYVKSVRVGQEPAPESGVDFSRAGGPLEILLSPASGQIDGAVVNPKQQPVTGATVVLAPERREHNRLFKTATTDPRGLFSLRGITPGNYKLFAWEDVEQGAYHDPEFLKPFETAGEKISIQENSRATVQ